MSAERRREALVEGHIGLASVAQRVEANGGELELESDARIRDARLGAAAGSGCVERRRNWQQLTARRGGLGRGRLLVGRLLVRWLDRWGLHHGRFVWRQVDHATRISRIGRHVVERLARWCRSSVVGGTGSSGGTGGSGSAGTSGSAGGVSAGISGSAGASSAGSSADAGTAVPCIAFFAGPTAATSCSTRGVADRRLGGGELLDLNRPGGEERDARHPGCRFRA